MTKAELLKVLEPFDDDTPIYISGCYPEVYYSKGDDVECAHLCFEDEHYYNSAPGRVLLYPRGE